jgi:hypothetical protein
MKSSRSSKLGEPRHSANGTITDAGIGRLRFDLKDGDAHPDDACAALTSLRISLVGKKTLSKNQRQYLLRALNIWADGKTLDQAFGLKRPRRGRPNAALARQFQIAAEVLRELLKGDSLEIAAEKAGRKLGIGATQARLWWAENKISAIAIVRNERPPDRCPWSQDEAVRLAMLITPEKESN